MPVSRSLVCRREERKQSRSERAMANDGDWDISLFGPGNHTQCCEFVAVNHVDWVVPVNLFYDPLRFLEPGSRQSPRSRRSQVMDDESGLFLFVNPIGVCSGKNGHFVAKLYESLA